MGKRRFVLESDVKDLEDSLKKSKNPLQARDGIFERIEYNRQVFQCEEEEYKIDWLTSTSKPFPSCQIADFLNSPFHSMTELEEQCSKRLELTPKKNDLYQFAQSREICTMTDEELIPMPRLKEFRDEIHKLKPFMSAISGTEITGVSMFFAEYKFTDHLLTHEDDLENRVIAFVYYLNSDDWLEKDGGHFDFFESDASGTPKSICRSWLPKRNYLNFFRVTENSYHQVGEVFSRQKVRRSLSGWFHAKDAFPPRPEIVSTTPEFILKRFNDESTDYDMTEWINPLYLTMDSMAQIQTNFEEDSEIQLTDFINPAKYELILQYLMKSVEQNSFVEETPFNRKSTFELPLSILSDDKNPVGMFLKILTSDHFFLLLSNWTGLKLHQDYVQDTDSEDEEDEEKVQPLGGAYRSSVRKWQHKNYTLLHDADCAERASLDLFVHVLQKTSTDVWEVNKGGSVTYITKGEDEELLTVTPKRNALSLVYRDEDTLRFVKYLNKRTAKDFFFDIFNCYYE